MAQVLLAESLISQMLAGWLHVADSESLDEAEIHVEFAYLRDWWDSIPSDERRLGKVTPLVRERANEANRTFIRQLFERVPSLAPLAASDLPVATAEFNAFCIGEAGARITKDIASPALWSVKSLAERFRSSPETFLDLCRLKWSFHIKPDLVVIIPGIAPLCVEAKLESGEGVYPSGGDAALVDKVFGERTRVGQFDLQRFMFEKLLARPCVPVVIQKLYPRTPSYSVLVWGEVVSSLISGGELERSIPFVSRLIEQNASLHTSFAAHRMWGGG